MRALVHCYLKSLFVHHIWLRIRLRLFSKKSLQLQSCLRPILYLLCPGKLMIANYAFTKKDAMSYTGWRLTEQTLHTTRACQCTQYTTLTHQVEVADLLYPTGAAVHSQSITTYKCARLFLLVLDRPSLAYDRAIDDVLEIVVFDEASGCIGSLRDNEFIAMTKGGVPPLQPIQ
jgi:hypothetical protein